jgi:chemotaxis protein MotA
MSITRLSISTFGIVAVCGALLAVMGLEIAGLIRFDWIPQPLRVLNVPSILLVLAGVGLATVISHPPEVIRRSVPYLFRLLSHSRSTEKSLEIDIVSILGWQHQMRANRLKTRAELATKLEHSFEGYVFGLASTDYSEADIRRLAEAKLTHRHDEIQRCADMFGDMSRFSPAFGMLGTLIGLIQMLGSFENVNELGRGLSFALMTTLYGILLANTLFGPLESKIRNVAYSDMARSRLMLDGILMIQSGAAPLVVFDHLSTNKSALRFEPLPTTVVDPTDG